MRFVYAYIYGDLEISSAPLLPSNDVNIIGGTMLEILEFLFFSSFSKFMIGITPQRNYNGAIYLASIVSDLFVAVI